MSSAQSTISPPTLERVLICSHCRGAGAEYGHYEDAHVDLVECIEALRDQLAALQRRVADLEGRNERQAA